MEIFLTGGTGYVGGAVLRALVTRGHRVAVLVRSAGRLDDLADAGVREIVGDLRRPESFASEAEEAEAIVHCTLEYGPEGERQDLEVATVETLLDALASGKPGHLVYTSSLFETPATPGAPLPESVDGLTGWRAELERRVVGAGGAALLRSHWHLGRGPFVPFRRGRPPNRSRRRPVERRDLDRLHPTLTRCPSELPQLDAREVLPHRRRRAQGARWGSRENRQPTSGEH